MSHTEPLGTKKQSPPRAMVKPGPAMAGPDTKTAREGLSEKASQAALLDAHIATEAAMPGTGLEPVLGINPTRPST